MWLVRNSFSRWTTWSGLKDLEGMKVDNIKTQSGSFRFLRWSRLDRAGFMTASQLGCATGIRLEGVHEPLQVAAIKNVVFEIAIFVSVAGQTTWRRKRTMHSLETSGTDTTRSTCLTWKGMNVDTTSSLKLRRSRACHVWLQASFSIWLRH